MARIENHKYSIEEAFRECFNGKLKAFTAWTAANIDERQEMLAELVKDVWKTSLIEVS